MRVADEYKDLISEGGGGPFHGVAIIATRRRCRRAGWKGRRITHGIAALYAEAARRFSGCYLGIIYVAAIFIIGAKK